MEEYWRGMITGWIGMKLGRLLTWNPETEPFVGDETANSMRSRPERAPYGLSHMKEA